MDETEVAALADQPGLFVQLSQGCCVDGLVVEFSAGGRLAFSVGRARPGQLQGARVDNLTLADGTRLPVVHYSHDAPEWTNLLIRHGFTAVGCVEVPARRADASPTLVLTATQSRG